MTYSCSHDGCFEDTTCALGSAEKRDCQHYQQPPADLAEQVDSAAGTDGQSIPWNGHALGRSDLAILAGRGRPQIIGLAGAPKSGKTSLLAFLYMYLLQRGRLGEWVFAGSWTLDAWETVVQLCRWLGDQPPSFPPHTSSAGRRPGLLHLSLRHSKTKVLKDIFIADAPGEWFTEWSQSPGSSAAEGARWVFEHSDQLLLLVDCAGLADPETRPASRRAARDLIERAGAHFRQEAISFLWAKSDVSLNDAGMAAVDMARQDFMPLSRVRRPTIKDVASVVACFNEVLDNLEGQRRLSLVEPVISTDPFLALRSAL